MTPDPTVSLQIVTSAGTLALACGCTVQPGDRFASITWGRPPHVRRALSLCLDHCNAIARAAQNGPGQ